MRTRDKKHQIKTGEGSLVETFITDRSTVAALTVRSAFSVVESLSVNLSPFRCRALANRLNRIADVMEARDGVR